MATELSELIRERAAERVRQGKRPSKADLEWLDAVREHAAPSSSVELSRNAKGDTQITVKVADQDPHAAKQTAQEIFTGLRAMFPMSDGTVGSPMRSDADRAASAAAAIAHKQVQAAS